MEGQPSIKCEPEEFPEIDLNEQPPSDRPVGMKIEEPDDAFEDARFVTQSAFVKEELDCQGAHIMEVTIHEKVTAELVPLVKKETPSSSGVDMKEGVQDGESAASGNHPNEFLNITEGQPSIKCEPEELPEIDLNEQPPSDSPVWMKIEEPDDAFEDERFITQSAFVKEELDFQGAYIIEGTGDYKEVTIHERVTAEVVPLVKKETPSSSRGGDARVDMKEEIQDRESAASGNHPNELGCPDNSDPAVRKIYPLCNTRGQNTSTVSERNITNQENLLTKLLTHTGEKRYSCNTCEAKFSLKSSLKRHMLSHTGEKPFSCSICKVKFREKGHLKTHMLTHTGEKRYSCSICEAKFSQNGSLKTHMLTHTGEKRYSCSICEAKFSQNGSLKTHMLTHTGERPFSCSTCEAKFTENGSLKRHMLSHTGEKPFSCSICKVKFREKGHLKTHMLTHTGEKRYSCGTCEAKFRHTGSLKRHMLTHTGEKAFSCSKCAAKLNLKGYMKTHMLTHTGEKPFSCSICEAKFCRIGSLKRHILTHCGEKTFLCSTCGVKFSQIGNLKKHMCTHTAQKRYSCSHSR